MNKKIFIGVILIMIVSIILNISQFKNLMDYKEQEVFQTKIFEESLDELIDSLAYYDDEFTVTNEVAIKNSAVIVQQMNSTRSFTSYKSEQNISLILHYLSRYFVLNTNEAINQNISEVESFIIKLRDSLQDENELINLRFDFENFLKMQQLK